MEHHEQLVSSSLTSHKVQEPVQPLWKAEPMCPYAISIRIPLFLFKIHDFSLSCLLPTIPAGCNGEILECRAGEDTARFFMGHKHPPPMAVVMWFLVPWSPGSRSMRTEDPKSSCLHFTRAITKNIYYYSLKYSEYIPKIQVLPLPDKNPRTAFGSACECAHTLQNLCHTS